MSIASDDLLALIKSRRSLRRYRSTTIDHDIIEQILEAGLWGPSAHNRQPWRYVLITSAETKDTLARAMGARLRHDLEKDDVPEAMIVKDVGRSYERITKAPVIIIICLSMVDMDRYSDDIRQANEHTMASQSVAMAAQNMLLMAHALGLGACWMCAPLFCQDVVQETLQLPTDFEPEGMITLGYPDQERDKAREPLATRVIYR